MGGSKPSKPDEPAPTPAPYQAESETGMEQAMNTRRKKGLRRTIMEMAKPDMGIQAGGTLGQMTTLGAAAQGNNSTLGQ